MDADHLQRIIDRVKEGRLSRRGFIQRMAVLGLTAPMANQLLAIGGVAMAEPASSLQADQGAAAAARSSCCGGRRPTLLNPHFAAGTKDQDGSRLFYEPLAAWDTDGNLAADPGRGDPEPRQRRAGRGRQVGHLEAQAGRQVARRQAVHRR